MFYVEKLPLQTYNFTRMLTVRERGSCPIVTKAYNAMVNPLFLSIDAMVTAIVEIKICRVSMHEHI
jgi:hypothetical protein